MLSALAEEGRPPSPRRRQEVATQHGGLGGARPEAGAGRGAAAAGRYGVAATWATALVVFSGPGHENDLAARLRARGVRVDIVDTKVGGAAHDVLRQDVGGRLVARTRRGEYDVVFIATPCESFSVAHRPQLRSRKQPDGLQNAPPEWAAYLRKHNALAAWSAQLAAAADEAGAAWAIENPADRGEAAHLRAVRAWWALAEVDHAAALSRVGAARRV